MSNLWVTATGQRMEPVAKMLTYQPTDGPTWEEVDDGYVWDHPERRRFLADVRRNGVREPIPVDYDNDPPTVEDGHTRLLAAHKVGLTHVPTRHASGFDLMMERFERGEE